MSLSTLAILAAETTGQEPAVPAWAVGAVALGILLVLLLALVGFAGGREHS